MRFEIRVSTGDQRVSQALYPVKWAIMRALKNWLTTLRALRFNGEPLVVTAKAVSVAEGVSETDLNRGILSWSAVWACECDLWFQTRLM